MGRVSNEHGAFDAPDAWDERPGLGAVARLPDGAADAAVRPSIVLTGDTRGEGVTMGAYVLTQKATLAQLLANWRMIDEDTPETEPGPAVLRHCFLPPDEGWVIQYQAYWFFGERVAVLTATAPSAEGAAVWEAFSRAVASYAPA